jgi:hypothetical protein
MSGDKRGRDDSPLKQQHGVVAVVMDGWSDLVALYNDMHQQTPNWMYASSANGTAGVRLAGDTEWTDNDGYTHTAVDVLQRLYTRFSHAGKGYVRVNSITAEIPQLARVHCGSSNCFQANVPLVYNPDLILLLHWLHAELFNEVEPFTMPLFVSMRTPMKAADVPDTRDTLDELAITLHMAHLSLSPPVLAAFPFNEEGTIESVGENNIEYAYVTESGWVDLKDLLDNLHTKHRTGIEFEAAKSSIAKSILALMRNVAKNYILLMDIKLTNMVGRRRAEDSTDYDVRMIDFGAIFTTDVNMHHINPDNAQFTSAECVFFVNGMLLLHQSEPRSKSEFFDGLAFEVCTTWWTMQEPGRSDFCVLLSKDKRIPLVSDDLPTLSMVSPAAFHAALRDAFYVVLENYGVKKLGVPPPPHPPADDSYSRYISRIVHRLEEVYGVYDDFNEWVAYNTGVLDNLSPN